MFLIPIAAGAAASAAVGTGITIAGITISGAVAGAVVGAVAGALVAESEGGDWKMGAVTGALGGWTGSSLVSSFSAAGEGAASQALAEEAAAAGTNLEPIATEAGIVSEMTGVAPAKDVGVLGTRGAATQALAPSAVQTMQVPAKPGLAPTSGQLAGQATTPSGVAGASASGTVAGGAKAGVLSAPAGTSAEAQMAMADATRQAGTAQANALVRSAELQGKSATEAAKIAQESQDTALKFQMLGSMMEGMAADEEGKSAQDQFNQRMAWEQEMYNRNKISLTPTASAPAPTPLQLRNPGVVYDWQKQPNPQTIYRV